MRGRVSCMFGLIIKHLSTVCVDVAWLESWSGNCGWRSATCSSHRWIRCDFHKVNMWTVLFLLLFLVSLAVRKEQRSNIKFYQKNGMSVKETWNDLDGVFGQDCLSLTQVRFWWKRFVSSATDISNQRRSGRPNVRQKKVQQIAAALDEDRRKSIRQLFWGGCNGTDVSPQGAAHRLGLLQTQLQIHVPCSHRRTTSSPSENLWRQLGTGQDSAQIFGQNHYRRWMLGEHFWKPH